jgi:MFS family permease
LGVLSGVSMISGSVYMGCNTIGANRTVPPNQRATMNGLSSVGTSIGRALGPICAGFLVSVFMSSSSGIPGAAVFGGWIVYVVLVAMGMGAYWTTLSIPDEEGG